MTLQKILLKLSRVKKIGVECIVCDDKCTVLIKEWYSSNTLKQIELDLKEKIDISQFSPFL